MNFYSYVVRYDSGFAPNPFYGYCTLATCKRKIRQSAKIGDWIIGSGSAAKDKQQSGKLVYAMKISEVLSFNNYYEDPRFQKKKPLLIGSKKQARGDNIYYQNERWEQLDSYHSHEDGSADENHIKIDTPINRVLISNYYCYFGCEGPLLPKLKNKNGKGICHERSGHRKFSSELESDQALVKDFIKWFEDIKALGYLGHPYDWGDTQ